MPFQVTVLKALIASPSDPHDERQEAVRALHAWNGEHAEHHQIAYLPQLWEERCYPLLGDRPQSLVNAQLVDRCDMVIAIFSARLGTPTGVDKSGTFEEIRRCAEAGKVVMVYFNTGFVPLTYIDPAQLQELNEAKAELQPYGIIGSYGSPADLHTKLRTDLTSLARDRFPGMRPADPLTKEDAYRQGRQASIDLLRSTTA